MSGGGLSLQGRKIRVPVPGPPENLYGGEVAGTKDFAYFSRKSYGPGGPPQKKTLTGTGTEI